MDIDTFLAKRAELAGLLKEHAKDMLSTLFGELFAAAPEIKTITWKQYTPYFNDGDSCNFSVRQFYCSTKFPEDMKDFDPDSEAEEDGWVATYNSENPAIKAFSRKFDDADIVLETLGDHSEIKVTNRSDCIKIEVEEYEHD